MSCVCELPHQRDQYNIVIQCMVYFSYGKTRLVGGCDQDRGASPRGFAVCGSRVFNAGKRARSRRRQPLSHRRVFGVRLSAYVYIYKMRL